MKTAYCPKGEKEIGSGTVGTAYGHVPGHQYHDVDVVISCVPTTDKRVYDSFRCHVCETWGSAQGCDEEHGRNEVVVRGATVSGVVADARRRGIAAGIEGVALNYLEQALSKAEDAAFNVVMRDRELSWMLAHSVKEEVVAGLQVRVATIFELCDDDWATEDLPRPTARQFLAVLEELKELYNDRWEQDFKAAVAMAKAALVKAALEE